MNLIPLLRQLNRALLDSVDKSERQVTTEYQFLLTSHFSQKGNFVDAQALIDLQIAVAHFLDEVSEGL